MNNRRTVRVWHDQGSAERGALGDAAFAAAWAAGQALTLEAAIAFALESPSPSA